MRKIALIITSLMLVFGFTQFPADAAQSGTKSVAVATPPTGPVGPAPVAIPMAKEPSLEAPKDPLSFLKTDPITHVTTGTCRTTAGEGIITSYQLTQFSVNQGVIGPNIYILRYSEILIYQYYYGYLIGWITANSLVYGTFDAWSGVIGHTAHFIPYNPLGRNILIMVAVHTPEWPNPLQLNPEYGCINAPQ